jgi:hypothetical protein
MASSSASVSRSGPTAINRSLGLSLTGQFLILFDFILALASRQIFNLFRVQHNKLP